MALCPEQLPHPLFAERFHVVTFSAKERDALLADAGHMLTDVAGVGLALLAIWFAEKPASPERTYGYYRVEILAALTNAVVLIVISLYILYEAYRRFRNPPEVESAAMLGVAVVVVARR